ncbi:unnamed protein product [Rotaria sp. Silwood2]|nr:unnamed protein product [Rotaria sp. Silwood2]
MKSISCPNLKQLTVTIYRNILYYEHFFSLFRRLSTVEHLTLLLAIGVDRRGPNHFIDGFDLQREIVSYMPHLQQFKFHIRSILRRAPHIEVDTIRQSFVKQQQPVDCVLDFFKNRYGQCQIYSLPFIGTRLDFISNRFPFFDIKDTFSNVSTLLLFDDVKPFESVFFERMVRSLPRLKTLEVFNQLEQEEKGTINTNVIEFTHLTALILHDIHVDYAKQLLCRSRLPCLVELIICNDSLLVIIAENNQHARENCSKVESLQIIEPWIKPTSDQLNFFPSVINLLNIYENLRTVDNNDEPGSTYAADYEEEYIDQPSPERDQKTNCENRSIKSLFCQGSFSSSVLLRSNTLRNKAIRSDTNDSTSLVDVVLIFLNKWYATSIDLNDDDENNNTSSSLDEPNQILRLLRSSIVKDGKLTPVVDKNLNTSKKITRDKDRQLNTSQIIIPYIDAKYDRVRLMAMSTLSSIMDFQDFGVLQEKKPNMAQDIVKLIFDFIDRAVAQGNSQYKGISFELLLRYLLRFLVQDFVKKQMIQYIPKIITYVEQRHLNALKILRKCSSSPEMKQNLTNNFELNEFLTTKANALFASDPRMKKIIDQIRQNLAPEEQQHESPVPIDINTRQAFISYCHRDRAQCDKFVQALKQANLFTDVWVDRSYMKDDMVDTITSAIRQSKAVFVLLSDAYCTSDFCRREWQFAITKKIKIYPVFVQEDFKRDAFDWVVFNIGHSHFYKIYKNDELQRLIKNLRSESHERPKSPMNLKNDLNESQVLIWTSEDIQDWCRTNNLEKWCEPLAHYHGKALLELNRMLENDTNIQYIVNGRDITLTDVVLFKCELQKLLLKRKTTHKLPKKKDVMKYRSTDMSTK